MVIFAPRFLVVKQLEFKKLEASEKDPPSCCFWVELRKEFVFLLSLQSPSEIAPGRYPENEAIYSCLVTFSLILTAAVNAKKQNSPRKRFTCSHREDVQSAAFFVVPHTSTSKYNQ